MLEFLNARTDIRRKAGEIYGAIVTQARHPALYAGLGVPDTPSGRYEMVVLHLFLVMERLGATPETAGDLPRLLVEAFIADMDDSLREMATGDLTVPKKVRRAATGLYERSMAYRLSLAERDEAGLLEALAEHVYGQVDASQAGGLARYIAASSRMMSAADGNQVAAGRPAFVDPASMTEAR
jgi:cytochrome b pre-mRNA-processing protein 3